jgi:cytochrome P450
VREAAPRREIRGYHAVRAAAKDVEAYSSDLIGDRDTRAYKQVPLEHDPPRHTRFREAVNPLFMSQNIEPKAPEFERIARELIQGISARGGGDLGRDLALPYVMGCLTVIYNRPGDLDEWVSWGPDVWTADAYRQGLVTPEARRAARERSFTGPSLRSGATLQAYLERVFDAATPSPGADPATTDVWNWIAGLEVDGEPLTRDEMYGIANVLLAGGRDTVIKLITGLTWHLIANPDDRRFLTENRTAFSAAIAELVRFLSPLPKIERVLAADRATPIAERDPQRYVLLNFQSANHDRSIWPDADVLDLHRERRPHLAFGFGRHSCMGMNITEYEAKAFLTALLDEWPGWEFDGDPQLEWANEGEGDAQYTALERFSAVHVRMPA